MRSRFFGLGVLLFFGALFHWQGCGETLLIPKLCSSSADCSGRTCVGGTCVGKLRSVKEKESNELAPAEGEAPKREQGAEVKREEQRAEPKREELVDASGSERVEPEKPVVPELDCNPGEKRPCYTGPAGTEGKGLCKAGEQECVAGIWSGCLGEVTPLSTEACGDSKDNNCNGVVDEGCPCDYAGLNQGVCKGSTRDAQGKCQEPTGFLAKEDICGDNKDNNCNGEVDEGCQCKAGAKRVCGSDVGECKKGEQICTSAGRWGATCKGEIRPSLEKCDGKDNNCNGVIDESCPCNFDGKSKGVCVNSQRDTKGVCIEPSAYSKVETCGDKLDNNCDGKTDNNCLCQYLGVAKGVCLNSSTDDQGVCKKPSKYGVESCGDGLDNNCDGAVDEGCPCDYNGAKQGVCAGSKRNAQGQCIQPSGYASSERCGDGLDNNCDGAVDEGCPCNYKNRTAGVCSNGSLGTDGKCKAPSSYASSERCGDKLDNNCDGVVDEGCSCNYKGLTQGVCAQSTRDSSGRCQQPSGYASSERCGDNIDNNCDGLVDQFSSNTKCLAESRCKTRRDGGWSFRVCRRGTPRCSSSSSSSVSCILSNTSTQICSSFSDAVKCSIDSDCSPCSNRLRKTFQCKERVCRYYND